MDYAGGMGDVDDDVSDDVGYLGDVGDGCGWRR